MILFTLDDKIAALFEAHFNDEIPTSTYEKMRKKFVEEKELLEKRLSAISYVPKTENVDNLSVCTKDSFHFGEYGF